MVSALEEQSVAAAGEGACRAQCIEIGFGAGITEAYEVERGEALAHEFRKGVPRSGSAHPK